MRCESDSAGEERGSPTPFRRSCSGGGESEQSGGWRTNERVDGVPKRIEVGDFVRKEFLQVERDGNSKHPGMRKNLQARRQVENSEALKQAERRHSGVKIEAGRKSGTEGQAEGVDR